MDFKKKSNCEGSKYGKTQEREIIHIFSSFPAGFFGKSGLQRGENIKPKSRGFLNDMRSGVIDSFPIPKSEP